MASTPLDRAGDNGDLFAPPEAVARLTPEEASAESVVLEYFTGSQASIYFDDYLIDEVVSIEYSLVTNRRPLYGYGSMVFDTVADGNTLVQGSFVINYVEANYVNIIAQAIKDRKDRLNKEPPPLARFGFGDQSVDGLTDEQLQDVVNQIRGMSNADFIGFADFYKKDAANRKGTDQSKLPTTTASHMPFDIWVGVGDDRETAGHITTRQLKEVYLIGQSHAIRSNGQPIQEAYSFIAREII